MNRLLAILTLIIISSCTQSIDLDKEKEAIMALHNAQRAHHLNNNAEEFVNQFSAHFYNIDRGRILQPTKEENTKRFSSYFGSVEFIKWDDVREPIISISDDGSMAYTIVEKIVILKYPTSEGTELVDSTHYAWTSIYKKYDGLWKLDCITSTKK